MPPTWTRSCRSASWGRSFTGKSTLLLLRTPLSSSTACATGPAGLITPPVRVLRCELVAVLAVRLAAVSSEVPLATHGVFAVSNGFEVRDLDAGSVSTEVIDLQAGRDRTTGLGVDDAVCHL